MPVGSNILSSNDYVPLTWNYLCEAHSISIFYKIVAEESGENRTESFFFFLPTSEPFLLDKPIISTHNVKNAALKKKGQGKHTWLLGNCKI